MPLATIDRPAVEAPASDVAADRTSDTTIAQLPLVIDLPAIRPLVLNILRLILETTVIPSVLFSVLMGRDGLGAALGASVGWIWLATTVRCISQGRAPTTLLLGLGVVTGRALLALAASSSTIFLIQPILGAVAAGIVFTGSAFIGRPLTLRLAGDFVHVPAHVAARPRVRRMFKGITVLWGMSRFAGAAMGFSLLHADATTAALGRGLFTPLITIGTIAAVVTWAVLALRKDGVHLRRATKPAATDAIVRQLPVRPLLSPLVPAAA